MRGEIGCAERYTAVLHWRGGGQVYSVSGLGGLTEVVWARTLNDISEARITISKEGVTPECCTEVGATEPWIHELSIYRDGELVWQGPVVRTVEGRTTFAIEAMDVLGWLDRVVNTFVVQYVAASGSDAPGPPPAGGRYRRPLTQIAENIIRLNLMESSLSVPPDWAGIMPYIVRVDPPENATFEKDGTSNTAIWSEYLTVILAELAKRGLYYTTVGRSLVLTRRTTLTDLPVAQLTLEHFLGDVEVIREGHGGATLAFATNQQANQLDGTTTVTVGQTGTEYGRLDFLEKVVTDEESPDPATVQQDLLRTARAALAGRYPAPIAVNVPEGSMLSPTAPVLVEELVCGQRIDVATTTYCARIQQPFVLSEVVGEWNEGSERIGISLIPMADPYGNEVDPGFGTEESPEESEGV